MKMTVVLLVVAVVGSAALVASAQQQSGTVVTTSGFAYGQEAPKTAVIAQPAPVPRAIGAARKNGNMFYTALSPEQPLLWSFSHDESGLSQQAQVLAQQLAEAKSDSDRDKLKGQLAEVLEKQFDERQKRHEDELKALEAQVKKLKDLVDKRQENRRDIIRARLNQIEKESQGLGW